MHAARAQKREPFFKRHHQNWFAKKKWFRQISAASAAARRSSGGVAAEAQRSLCAGRSSSRTIDEETSKRENENEAERAITFRVRRGRRAASTLPLPVKCASSVAGAAPPPRRRLPHHARCAPGVRTPKFWSDMGFSSLVIFLLRWGSGVELT